MNDLADDTAVLSRFARPAPPDPAPTDEWPGAFPPQISNISEAPMIVETIASNSSGESVPPSPSPEQPPLAPHDPPEPAPQAAAWQRALRVIVTETRSSNTGLTKSRVWRTNKRGRAAIKSRKNH